MSIIKVSNLNFRKMVCPKTSGCSTGGIVQWKLFGFFHFLPQITLNIECFSDPVTVSEVHFHSQEIKLIGSKLWFLIFKIINLWYEAVTCKHKALKHQQTNWSMASAGSNVEKFYCICYSSYILEVIDIDFWQIWYFDFKSTGWVGLQLSIILTVGRFDM